MAKNTYDSKYTNQRILNHIYDPDEETIAVSVDNVDIQIGAVELKDGSTDTRAAVSAANTAKATTTNVLATQHIDGNGVVGGVRPSQYSVDDSTLTSTPAIMPIGGEYRATATTYTDGDATILQHDINGNVKQTLATAIAGEDLTNDVLKTEQRFSYTKATADAAVKSGAGFIHSICVTCTDADGPTAGTLTLYDNTAESGTEIWESYIDTSLDAPIPCQIIDASFATGLYLGFATVDQVNVTITYR